MSSSRRKSAKAAGNSSSSGSTRAVAGGVRKQASARRPRADGRETRARVLDAAAQVFARDGFEGASLRRIAEAAGIDIATLKYHVRDKAALFAEVYQDGYQQFQQALGPLLLRLPLARDADELVLELRKLLERGYDYLETNQRFVRLWLFRLLQGPREVLDAEELLRVQVTTLIERVVEILRERGLVREVDAHVLALVMITTLPMLALGTEARPDLLGPSQATPRARVIEFLLDMVRRQVMVSP
jgi:AcrR family transcriptional regulator